MTLGYSPGLVALRLQALRCVIEGDYHGAKTVFAKRLGIDRSKLSHYERTGDLPRDAAIQIVQALNYAITTDWLWLGRTDGLAVAMAKHLDNAVHALETATEAIRALQKAT